MTFLKEVRKSLVNTYGTKSGVTTNVIAWMLQTHSMALSLIYTVNFSLWKNYTNKCLSKLSSAGGA